jgi:hypothetical protein
MALRTVQPTLIKTPYHADLLTRIRAEYIEMPGLCLTLSQAAKLWNVDRDTCAMALDSLTATGFLRRRGEVFLRSGSGRAHA